MECCQIRMILVGFMLLIFTQLTACGGGDGGDNKDDAGDEGDPLDTTYTISGTVTGLAGNGLVLQNNGGDDLTIDANGGFSFAAMMTDGIAYAVTIATQPADQICAVVNGNGTLVGADITNIIISCPLQPAMLSVTSGGPKLLSFSWSDVGADHYKLLKNPDGASGYIQVGEDIPANRVDEEIAIHLTDWVNASYLIQACNIDGDCVNSTPVPVTSAMLDVIGFFKASNTREFDYFGSAIALSDDGNTLAVGAPFESTQINGDPSNYTGAAFGAVYLFVRNGAAWAQQGYLKASNAEEGDYFGISLALSAAGNTLAVGVPRESSAATGIDGDQSDNSALDSGAVYLFERLGATWSQQAYIKASNTGGAIDIYGTKPKGDNFGESVVLSDDGNILAVSAPQEDSNAIGIGGDQSDNSSPHAGAVYLFQRHVTGWSQSAYVKASNTDADDRFGSSLALTGDGLTLVVGATGESSASTGINGDQLDNSSSGSGAAYLFKYDGISWSQKAYFKAMSPRIYNQFGSALSLSDNGDILAISASGSNFQWEGAVYLYELKETNWRGSKMLKPEGLSFNSQELFGADLALSNDGNILVVGAPGEDSAAIGIGGNQSDDTARGTGAVFLYKKSGTTWNLDAYIKATNGDEGGLDTDWNVPLAGDSFGGSLGLSGDGNILAVGAACEDSNAVGIGGDQEDNTAENSGAVYLY